MLFCRENLTRWMNWLSLQARIQTAHLLVYLRSSVTAVPPFGEPLSSRRALKSLVKSFPMIPSASCASLDRISRGVRVDVGISKYSPCCLNSYGTRASESATVTEKRHTANANGQNCCGATRATWTDTILRSESENDKDKVFNSLRYQLRERKWMKHAKVEPGAYKEFTLSSFLHFSICETSLKMTLTLPPYLPSWAQRGTRTFSMAKAIFALVRFSYNIYVYRRVLPERTDIVHCDEG